MCTRACVQRSFASRRLPGASASSDDQPRTSRPYQFAYHMIAKSDKIQKAGRRLTSEPPPTALSNEPSTPPSAAEPAPSTVSRYPHTRPTYAVCWSLGTPQIKRTLLVGPKSTAGTPPHARRSGISWHTAD